MTNGECFAGRIDLREVVVRLDDEQREAVGGFFIPTRSSRMVPPDRSPRNPSGVPVLPFPLATN